MINHIQWVIGTTIVEHLNEDDATELHLASIQWMDEVSCSHTLSEIAEFQDDILDRMFDLNDSTSAVFLGEQQELFDLNDSTSAEEGELVR